MSLKKALNRKGAKAQKKAEMPLASGVPTLLNAVENIFCGSWVPLRLRAFAVKDCFST
ncbi:MAG: hypothetical protein PHX38_06920 [Sulfuricella sp.]|nr:hypothetical protein [Sulfuricella sp.]